MISSNDNLAMVASNDELALAFPAIQCPIKPLGNRVLVQIRLPKQKSKGGLYLTSDTTEDSYRQEQTAKVIKLGSGAFHFPSSGEAWPSGEWYKVGDYVRVPLHGGDNHWIAMDNEDKTLVLFKTFKDYEVISMIEGDPLDMKTNLAYL